MTDNPENPNNIRCDDEVQWQHFSRDGRRSTTKRGKVVGTSSTHAVVRTPKRQLVKRTLVELTVAQINSPLSVGRGGRG